MKNNSALIEPACLVAVWTPFPLAFGASLQEAATSAACVALATLAIEAFRARRRAK